MQSAPLVNASAVAGRMAYLRVRLPHAHSVLRLLVLGADPLGMYVQRGAAPEATRALEVPRTSKWREIELSNAREYREPRPRGPPTLSERVIAEHRAAQGLPPDRSDEERGTAPEPWYVGLQGRHFFLRQVSNPDHGDFTPVWDGPHLLTAPPVVGNFMVRANESSQFSAYLASDFEIRHFGTAGCGAQPARCGLRTVGAAAAGGVHPDGAQRNATLLRGRPMDAGALWQREPLPLSRGFETSFSFRIADRTLCTAGPRANESGCIEDAFVMTSLIACKCSPRRHPSPQVLGVFAARQAGALHHKGALVIGAVVGALQAHGRTSTEAARAGCYALRALCLARNDQGNQRARMAARQRLDELRSMEGARHLKATLDAQGHKLPRPLRSSCVELLQDMGAK